MAPYTKEMLHHLATSDDSPVWSAFIDQIEKHDEPHAAGFPVLSAETFLYMYNAFQALATMRIDADHLPEVETMISSVLKEIETDFIEYIFNESLSTNVLVVSSGRASNSRDVVRVKQFYGLYFVKLKAMRISGHYTSLCKCLSVVRSYLIRSHIRLRGINYSETVPAGTVSE